MLEVAGSRVAVVRPRRAEREKARRLLGVFMMDWILVGFLDD